MSYLFIYRSLQLLQLLSIVEDSEVKGSVG
jgi:hypothetical protein